MFIRIPVYDFDSDEEVFSGIKYFTNFNTRFITQVAVAKDPTKTVDVYCLILTLQGVEQNIQIGFPNEEEPEKIMNQIVEAEKNYVNDFGGL